MRRDLKVDYLRSKKERKRELRDNRLKVLEI